MLSPAEALGYHQPERGRHTDVRTGFRAGQQEHGQRTATLHGVGFGQLYGRRNHCHMDASDYQLPLDIKLDFQQCASHPSGRRRQGPSGIQV